MAGASARCGAEDAGIATLEVDSGPSSSRRRTSSTTIFGDQGDRFRLYSMLQKRNSAMTYSESFLKTLSSTLRELWLLRETDLTFDVVPGQSSRSSVRCNRFSLLTQHGTRSQSTLLEAGALSLALGAATMS